MANESTAVDIYDISVHFDKRSWLTIERSLESILVILSSFSGIVLARVLTHRLRDRFGQTICYLLEFPLIALPGILFVTVAVDYSHHFVLLIILLSVWFTLHSRALSRARSRNCIDLGKRTNVLTVVRALTHLITATCILAVDFPSFHRPFRKSKHFGGQLMDTGIGLFVQCMGMVSRRTRHCADLRRSLLRSVLPLILLGIARVVAIVTVGYGQDAHEYGVHLNAFFMLGFTKLLGSLLSFLPRSDMQLLPLALFIVVIHQLVLSFTGLSDYVMDSDVPRATLFTSNREGIVSLPGFVAIYLYSICQTRWLLTKTQLSYAEFMRKLVQLLFMTLLTWTLMVASTFLIGISRVTCNLGYALWMCAIVNTMILLSLLIFELIVNNVLPLEHALQEALEQSALIEKPASKSKNQTGTFIICESINMNGLTFFLLANILTGGVNIFLQPENRSDQESLVILIIYMLLATFVVFQMYKRHIRIA